VVVQVYPPGDDLESRRVKAVFAADGRPAGRLPGWWKELSDADRARVADGVRASAADSAAAVDIASAGMPWRVEFTRETVRFPFRPCPGHPLGLDASGRDVVARLLYGLRVSMTFGMVLVVVATFVGTLVGGLQGYFGGWTDITGQRITEIWAALPFLYIILLLGSVFGQSFMLLLIVDALFGWIGISYYMRAEFLRLRSWPFVEAARALGLPAHRIMFRHILPNALVPIITFFPFNLVGAVSLLAALDFLGFGLPPPTPSWGELLFQGNENGWAWWLVVYPAVALFAVMLLSVFIGEGLRAAFDPRRHSRME
jgi:microcin C transport system permease protein